MREGSIVCLRTRARKGTPLPQRGRVALRSMTYLLFSKIFISLQRNKVAESLGLVTGFRLLLRGCNANNGVNSGPSDVNVNNDVSNSNVNIGALLNFLCDEIQSLSPWRKIN